MVTAAARTRQGVRLWLGSLPLVRAAREADIGPVEKAIDYVCERALKDAARARAIFLSDAQAEVSPALEGQVRADLRDWFDRDLAHRLAPDEPYSGDKATTATLLVRVALADNVLFRLAPRLATAAFARDLQAPFEDSPGHADTLAASGRRTEAVDLLLAALQDRVLAIPTELHAVRPSRPVKPDTEKLLKGALATIREVRARPLKNSVVRPFRMALCDLYQRFAEVDNFVWLPLKPLIAAPLLLDDLPLYARADTRASELARHIVRSAGVILIAGYRGVGKSSFVNYVLYDQVPKLTSRQTHEDQVVVVPVQVNLAKASSVESVLRLCIRAAYRELLQHPTVDLMLRADEREFLIWANMRASYKVDWRRNASVESMRHVEATLDFKLADMVPKALGVGNGLLNLLPKVGAKAQREWKDKLDRTVALLDYDENRAEEDLLLLLELLARPRKAKADSERIKLAFVFDEMDKMESDTQQQVVERCKNLFLSRYAVFMLVTSKDFYYEWLKGRDIEDSVLGSYFTSVVMVPLFSSQETLRLLQHLAIGPTVASGGAAITPSTLRDDILQILGQCLTYRAGGLPREIVRTLTDIQQWLDDIQPFISNDSGQMSVLQTFAGIQRELEALGQPGSAVAATSSSGVISGSEHTLPPARLWQDEARTEQIRRGLYLLVEDLLERGSLELTEDLSLPPPPPPGQPKPAVPRLAELFNSNFKLVPAADFRLVINQLADRLQKMSATDGSPLFVVDSSTSATSQARQLADRLQNVSGTDGLPLLEVDSGTSTASQASVRVLKVSDSFYAGTGRAKPIGPTDTAAPAPADLNGALLLMEQLVAPGSAAGRSLDALLLECLKHINASSTYPPGTLERLVRVLGNYQSSRLNRSDDADSTRESVTAAMLSAIEHGTPASNALAEIIGTFEATLPLKVSWVPPLLGLARTSPNGPSDLLLLLVKQSFISVPDQLIQDVLRQTRGEESNKLWRELVERRSQPLANKILEEILCRLPAQDAAPQQVLHWLEEPDWSSEDQMLLQRASTRERRLVPFLRRATDGLPTDSAARARLDRADPAVDDAPQRTSARRGTPSSANAPAVTTPSTTDSLVRRVLGASPWAWLMCAWLLVGGIAYVAVSIDLSPDLYLGWRLLARLLDLVLLIATPAGLGCLVVTIWDRSLWSASLLWLGASCASFAILKFILVQPLSIDGQLWLAGILIITIGVPFVAWLRMPNSKAAPLSNAESATLEDTLNVAAKEGAGSET